VAYSVGGTVSSADPRYDGLTLPAVGVVNQALPAPTGTGPTAAEDRYHVFADGKLSVAGRAGVLANDTDADGDVLTAIVAHAPAHGRLELRPDGSFVYVPERGFAGTDSFRYVASDGTASSAPAEVTVVVDAAPTPPPTPTPGPGPQPPPPEDPAPPEPKQEPDPQPEDKGTHTEPEVDKPTHPGVVPPEPKKEVPPPPDKPPGPPPPANGGEQRPPAGPDQGGPDGGIELGPPKPRIMLEIPGAGVPAINTRAASVSLVIGLESMARQMGSRNGGESVSVRAVRHAFVTITVGYVVWSLRGASLLASLLTSMPLWRSLDPLPILENRSKSSQQKKKRRRWFSRRGRGGGAQTEQALGEMVR
jgi:hypothetical protein